MMYLKGRRESPDLTKPTTIITVIITLVNNDATIIVMKGIWIWYLWLPQVSLNPKRVLEVFANPAESRGSGGCDSHDVHLCTCCVCLQTVEGLCLTTPSDV